MDDRRGTFTSGPGLSHIFDFFWERLILSPRLKAIPCETKEGGFIVADCILTDKSKTLLVQHHSSFHIFTLLIYSFNGLLD